MENFMGFNKRPEKKVDFVVRFESGGREKQRDHKKIERVQNKKPSESRNAISVEDMELHRWVPGRIDPISRDQNQDTKSKNRQKKRRKENRVCDSRHQLPLIAHLSTPGHGGISEKK